MGRCWRNPAAKGCKTCAHFDRNYDDYGDGCLVGVDLTGRPACTDCKGSGYADDTWDSGKRCPTCNGDAAEVKPGPITGCPQWAPSPSLLDERS
jgi:DnaJ-class molecular chaperone